MKGVFLYCQCFSKINQFSCQKLEKYKILSCEVGHTEWKKLEFYAKKCRGFKLFSLENFNFIHVNTFYKST
jgi:hypothetical protein